MLTQAICNHCGTANRLPTDKPPSAAKCGRCGEILNLASPDDVNDESLARHLKLTQGPILVDVWAPWCGPCKMMAPHFAAAAKRLEGQARLLKLNADQNQLPAQWGVRGIPALILFKDGREIARKSGLMQTEALVDWVRHQIVQAPQSNPQPHRKGA
jgi:thioredoxin 2